MGKGGTNLNKSHSQKKKEKKKEKRKQKQKDSSIPHATTAQHNYFEFSEHYVANGRAS